MKTLAAILSATTLFLAGCVTHIQGRVVNVTVSPTTSIRAQAVPTL